MLSHFAFAVVKNPDRRQFFLEPHVDRWQMVRKEVIFAIRMFLYIDIPRVSKNRQDNDGLTNLALHPDQEFRNPAA